MRKKRLLRIFIASVLLLGSLYILQRLLMPKYMSKILEGSLIEEYYKEKGNHDVIFIGDCEVYENISPITLWEDYGITSYIRGSAQQLIWQSYYLLEETLTYEKPKVVVFNVLSMKYGEPQNEAYNRMTLDGMRLSMSKIKSILASMTEDEHLIDYIFPILRYHSRWNEISGEDFKYLFNKDTISHNGYLMRVDVKPVTSVPTGKKLADYKFSDVCYDYLDKMVELCRKNDIKLVLMKAPSLYPYWYKEWDEQMVEYAKKNDLMYINFLDLIEETGIDFKEDTYDAGLHLNLSGAEKLSKYFGQILSREYSLPNHRDDEDLKKLWDEKVAFYNKMRDDQYRELKTYGYLASYGGSSKNN